jgi:hypothetical protein
MQNSGSDWLTGCRNRAKEVATDNDPVAVKKIIPACAGIFYIR